MDNILDLNLKVAIAFTLLLIAALLTYIAFFKESVERGVRHSSAQPSD